MCQAEADHCRHEQQRQHMEVRMHLVEIAPRENDRGREQQADEGPQSSAGLIHHEADPSTCPLRGTQPPNQYTSGPCALPTTITRQHSAGRASPSPEQSRRARGWEAPCRTPAAARDGQGHRHRHRRQRRHEQGGIRAASPERSGSSVPRRLWSCSARARRRAVTVAPITTSVSTSACRTGSTAGGPGGWL